MKKRKSNASGVGVVSLWRLMKLMEKNTLASYVHTHVAAMPDFGGNLAISSLELGG